MPQVAFTVQGLALELMSAKIDHEIVLINNAAVDQGFDEPEHPELNGPMYFEKLIAEGRAPRLRHVEYLEKLSHWNAKNAGIAEATGDFFFFCDAHVVITPGDLVNMFRLYQARWQDLNGSIHLPWNYMNDFLGPDGGGRRLEYRLCSNIEKGIIHYTSKTYKGGSDPYAVPCMSTCCMLIERKIFEDVGAWPSEMGIYGGGENYMNFVQAVLGYQPWIFPSTGFWHWAAPRGYQWNWYDWHRNRMIATYVAGGNKWARNWANWLAQEIKNGAAMGRAGNPQIALKLYRDVTNNEDLIALRREIQLKQKVALADWVMDWKRRAPDYVRWE